MIVYILLFFIAYITAIFEREKAFAFGNNISVLTQNDKTYIVYFVLVIFTCITGFRYELGGSDYEYYELYYERIADTPNLIFSFGISEYEPGYTAFIHACTHYLNLSFNGYLFLEAIIFYALMYLGLRKYVPNWGIFLMFFMYKMFFYVTFVAMRQAMTVAGFYLLYSYLQQGKVVKYYLLLALFSTFHYGALLLFIIYPLFRINYTKNNLKKIGLIFGVFIFLSDYTGSILNAVVSVLGLSQDASDKAAGYSGGKESLNILYTIEYYLLYILTIKNYDEIHQRFKDANFIIALFVMVLPIVTVFRSTVIFVRELPYFYPAYAILFTYIYIIYKKNAGEYLLLFSLICLAGVIKYVIEFGDGCLMPYQWWLFNPNIHIFAH